MSQSCKDRVNVFPAEKPAEDRANSHSDCLDQLDPIQVIEALQSAIKK
jgi:hypothetical protein